MREIKFRGMTVNDNKMVYGDLLQYRAYPVIFDKNKEQREVQADTVGQYTALNDTNGKEIYEGDICIRPSDRIQSVHYGPHSTWILSLLPLGNWELGKGPFQFLFKEYGTAKVIGNIYENPELLEGGE